MNLPKLARYSVLVTLALIPTLRAAPEADQRAKIRDMMKDRATAHMAFDEMLKDKENKRYMAKALAHDKEFRAFYNAEVGNSAPHQERNPSQHPELFRAKQ